VEPGTLPVRASRRLTALIGGNMDPLEAQSKAIIAAALIMRGAVEVPSVPSEAARAPDSAGMRLRELTEYVYRLLTMDQPPDE
jgi:hypothetical protein